MGIIKNAGWMWHRKYVNWHRGGELLGYPEEGNGVNPVDFGYQAALYALYDTNHNCIYIGQAGSGDVYGLYHRLKAHTHDYLFCMWERFSWFGFYPVENANSVNFEGGFEFRTDVNQILNLTETLCIHTLMPRFNTRKGTNISDIQWYYQQAEFDEREKEFAQLKEKIPSMSSK